MMQLKKPARALAALLMTADLASCSIGGAPQPTQDVNAIFTAAAQTLLAGMSAQQTQTAQAASPTSLPSPTPLASLASQATFAIGTSSVPFGTPRPITTSGIPVLPTLAVAGTSNTGLTAVGCDNATYVSETDPLDKAQISAGKDFTKGWQMQNTGTCSWGTGYSWAFASGDDMGCNSVVYKANDAATDPGHSNTFIVNCTAPSTAGEYKAFWQMKNDKGTAFGFSPWVDIVVK